MSASSPPRTLGDLDPVARFAVYARAQRGLRDPLPSELLDVLVGMDDLEHFVAVRREQERDG